MFQLRLAALASMRQDIIDLKCKLQALVDEKDGLEKQLIAVQVSVSVVCMLVLMSCLTVAAWCLIEIDLHLHESNFRTIVS